jgi:hypothetical protein
VLSRYHVKGEHFFVTSCISDVRSLKISTPKSWQNAETIASDCFLDFLFTESDHFVADDEDEDDDDDEPVVG